MGLKHCQARPRLARCTLCQRSQAGCSPGGVGDAWDLLAGSVRRLRDPHANGLPAYVTSRAALTGVPWRAARARRWPRLPRSTRLRSWRGSCRCAAAPVPALDIHLCRPMQTRPLMPACITDACLHTPAVRPTPPLTKLGRRRWSAWPCAPLACRPRCPRWWRTWRCCTALPAAARQPRRRRRRRSRRRCRSSMGRSCLAALLASAGQAQ